MKRYLFLLAWLDGSDSAGGDETNINSSDDLIIQYRLGNEHVSAVEIICNDNKFAEAIGYREAFFDNYTALDSVSTMIEIDEQFKHPKPIKVITV